MHNLVTKLSVYTSIDEKKAKAALLIVSAHIKERYPMLKSCADSILDIKELSLEKDGFVIRRFEAN
jgi:hypothetical protein